MIPGWQVRIDRAAAWQRLALTGVVASSLLLGGCFTTRAFVDPQAETLSYADLRKPASPLKLTVKADFQRDGQRFPGADGELREAVLKVLKQSGVIEPVETGAAGEISVQLNNLKDTESSAMKGVGTGLTFGLVGTTVTDHYQMAVLIRTARGSYSRPDIPGALHSASGNTTLPEGTETMPLAAGFQRTVEQMLLKALKDFNPATDLVNAEFRRLLTFRLVDDRLASLVYPTGSEALAQ